MITTNETGTPEAKKKSSEVDAKDAVNACKQGVAMLYCVLDADGVFPEDREEALRLATKHLNKQVNILRDYFGMDKEEAAL